MAHDQHKGPAVDAGPLGGLQRLVQRDELGGLVEALVRQETLPVVDDDRAPAELGGEADHRDGVVPGAADQ